MVWKQGQQKRQVLTLDFQKKSTFIQNQGSGLFRCKERDSSEHWCRVGNKTDATKSCLEWQSGWEVYPWLSAFATLPTKPELIATGKAEPQWRSYWNSQFRSTTETLSPCSKSSVLWGHTSSSSYSWLSSCEWSPKQRAVWESQFVHISRNASPDKFNSIVITHWPCIVCFKMRSLFSALWYTLMLYFNRTNP